MNPIIQKIKDQKIVPLFYNDSLEVSKNIVKALYDAGIRVIEFTNRGAKALEIFTQLKQIAITEFPELSLGIGTIKNTKEMDDFVQAKADFIITPVIDDALVKHAVLQNILFIPGCFTPSEVNIAYQNGLRLIKIFPGDVVGKTYVKSITPLFPQMEFMVTGGVSADVSDIKDWLSNGVCSVGLGSALVKSNSAPEELTSKVKELLNQLKSN